MKRVLILLLLGLALDGRGALMTPDDSFAQGRAAYEVGNFEKAASEFGKAAAASLAPGTLQNLGNAEWRAGHPGPAILAWERAQWLDPFNANAKNNLRYARKSRLLDAPELPWYEICSGWLPVNAWAWLAGFSFWLAAAMVMLPGIFRWRRMGWQQAVAAAGFAVFLLTLPAMFGVRTRAQIAVVLSQGTVLRLTPTASAQPLARLAAGETVRLERERGSYAYVRAGNGMGWINRNELGLIAGD